MNENKRKIDELREKVYFLLKNIQLELQSIPKEERVSELSQFPTENLQLLLKVNQSTEDYEMCAAIQQVLNERGESIEAKAISE
jgi:hypothetical protein